MKLKGEMRLYADKWRETLKYEQTRKRRKISLLDWIERSCFHFGLGKTQVELTVEETVIELLPTQREIDPLH